MKRNTKATDSETNNPLISVIVPAYNIENYVSDCLSSILSQNYKNIEIVIINDGSTDNTGKIIEKYKEEYQNKIVCIHQNNQGVMKARLEGIKAANGEWIGFVDGDDVVEDNMYERLLSNALAYRSDISHCGFQIVANHGERIHYFYNTGKLKEQDKNEGIKDLLKGDIIEPSLCNKLFSRSLFDKILNNHMLEKDFKFNEDLLLNYLLFKVSNKAIYEDFCPYHYIARTDSATRKSFNINKTIDPVTIQKFILDDSEGEIKEEAYKRYLLTCINACRALFDKPEYYDFYKKVKTALKNYNFKSHLLNRKTSFKLHLLLISPGLYNHIYKIYERYFQKKKYE